MEIYSANNGKYKAVDSQGKVGYGYTKSDAIAACRLLRGDGSHAKVEQVGRRYRSDVQGSKGTGDSPSSATWNAMKR